jgi:hypothetical protein
MDGSYEFKGAELYLSCCERKNPFHTAWNNCHPYSTRSFNAAYDVEYSFQVVTPVANER